MNLLLIFLYLATYETATADDDKQISSSPATTLEAGTSPPLIHTTPTPATTTKKIPCSGWCLDKIKPNHELKFNVNETLDQKLLKTFYLVKALIETIDQYPVKVDANTFADKYEYLDKIMSKTRSQMLNKNVINIPTIVFFPYTRTGIRKAILDSGSIYIPNMDERSASVGQSEILGNTPLGFLWKLPVFTNAYFTTNPLLHSNMNYQVPKRRSSTFKKKHSNSDPYNIGNHKSSLLQFDYDDLETSRRANSLPIRSSRLIDFVKAGSKKRSKKVQTNNDIQEMLGLPKQETILEHSLNSVDDIIAGMKIKGKKDSTFVIGSTKNAQTKINKWIGLKGRSKTLSEKSGNGLYLEGRSRSKAISALLKSMVQNYQFGDNTPTYKKISSL